MAAPHFSQGAQAETESADLSGETAIAALTERGARGLIPALLAEAIERYSGAGATAGNEAVLAEAGLAEAGLATGVVAVSGTDP